MLMSDWSSDVCSSDLQRRQLSWLSVTVVPQYAADADRPHQVLSMFSDVTELKRDSALFDRVQALAHIGGWEWDCTSDHLYLTDESARILAQDVPPVTMPGMVDCLAPGDRLRMRAALDHVIRDRQSTRLNSSH